MIQEGLRHRMQIISGRQARGGDDLGTVVRDGEGQAGGDTPAVEQYRARSALTVITALLRRGDTEMLAQQIEDCRAVVYARGVVDTVNTQAYLTDVG